MNQVDALVVVLLVPFTLRGWVRGFCRESVGLAGLLAGGLAAAAWGPALGAALVARHLMRPVLAEAIGCAGLFVAVNLVTHVLGALADRIALALFLGGINRVAGAVFGLAKGAALVGFALLVAERVVPSGTLTQVIAASRLGRPLTELATGVVGVGRTLNPTGPASPGAGNHQA